ncbi:pimeloyl-ACP methyl esterase BioG family protein [Flammeovirga sp. EKP202]|uniref:pimeloyl-ACP methyl esterase BioG family protein n=1 Tax=Flammeovirga sp. EKP202 TaxID=2770592 RepID=UPI00165FB412|nr:pimeloyl-ACP methyl esterase BioG family protein [Flammeovirga sp. EKP202]MBD0402732.1 DUF452 family protein [Flammeovirga sp. EKP202]
MQTHWLNKKDSDSVIIFFAGWGQSRHYFEQNLTSEKDVLMVCQYTHLDFNSIIEAISDYKEKTVIGWSFGVLVASKFMETYSDYNHSIAINGSLKPVDDTEGIPTAIFNGTLQLLSQKSWEKFAFRMIGDRLVYTSFIENNDREIDSLKDELAFLGQCESPSKTITFDQVLVSQKDRIFPSDNLMNSWIAKGIAPQLIDTHHFPFHHYHTWESIGQLNQTLSL